MFILIIILLPKAYKMRLILIFFFIFFKINFLFAQVAFDIKNVDDSKTKIIFAGFSGYASNLENDGEEVLKKIKYNLSTTNLFDFVQDKKNNIKTNNLGSLSASNNSGSLDNFEELVKDFSIESSPDFVKLSQAQISAVVIAYLNYDISGNLELRIRLWDVLDQRQLFGKVYTSSKDNFSKLGNIISDEIFKAITNEKIGHFNSKITYVSESGSVKNRIKKIAIVDFDGGNREFLTDGKELAITPTFSRKDNEIFYLRYYQNRPQIASLDIKSQRVKKVGGFRGTTFAASTHPVNKNIILLSAIFDGNSDIYEFNIEENRATRLTKSPAIDTTASYSPDGKKIIFVSDRNSRQEIYSMNINGSDVTKISQGSDGSYFEPSYSPDGSMIAFTRIKNKKFFIGTMSSDGRNERLIATGHLVEGPKWSPNGRYIIFSKVSSAYGVNSIPKLFTIDIVTGYEYQIPLPAGDGASDPDWINKE